MCFKINYIYFSKQNIFASLNYYKIFQIYGVLGFWSNAEKDEIKCLNL